MPQPKIPISAIDDVLRAAEQSPPVHETEVSKVEAMRRLAPALRSLQSKGYGLAQIARLLSDRGIAMTEVSLKHYLHRVAGRAVATMATPPKRKRLPAGTVTESPRQPSNTRHPASSARPAVASTTERPPSYPQETGAAPDSAPERPAQQESPRRPTQSSATETSHARAGFTVRPDRSSI